MRPGRVSPAGPLRRRRGAAEETCFYNGPASVDFVVLFPCMMKLSRSTSASTTVLLYGYCTGSQLPVVLPYSSASASTSTTVLYSTYIQYVRKITTSRSTSTVVYSLTVLPGILSIDGGIMRAGAGGSRILFIDASLSFALAVELSATVSRRGPTITRASCARWRPPRGGACPLPPGGAPRRWSTLGRPLPRRPRAPCGRASQGS